MHGKEGRRGGRTERVGRVRKKRREEQRNVDKEEMWSKSLRLTAGLQLPWRTCRKASLTQ